MPQRCDLFLLFSSVNAVWAASASTEFFGIKTGNVTEKQLKARSEVSYNGYFCLQLLAEVGNCSNALLQFTKGSDDLLSEQTG
jgi:hypothetical protein